MTSPLFIILASPKSEIFISEPGSFEANNKFSGFYNIIKKLEKNTFKSL